MKKMLLIIGALLLILQTNCSSGAKKLALPGTNDVTSEESKVIAIEKLFYLNDKEKFSDSSNNFLKENPNSIYTLFIKLLSSRLLFQENQLNQALEINEKVQKEAFDTNKKLYFEALFYSSDIYESLGKLDNSLAVLVECEKNKLFLNDKIRLFELPLKLSVSYARLNQKELSLNYIRKTESGLNEYLSMDHRSKKSLSEIYYEIGSGVLTPSFMDYYTDANKFSLVFKYLVYCLNLNESPYSEKAKTQLTFQLKSLWAQLQKEATPSTGDQIEDEKIRFKKLTEFSKLLNYIQLLEPLEEKQINPIQKDFFSYLNEIQKLTFNEIYSQYKYTPPTEESFRHRVFRDELKIENIDKKAE